MRARLLGPLVLAGAALWVAALPQLGLFPPPGLRWFLFVGGAFLVALGLLRHPTPAGDPGPYEPGLATAAPARRLSWKVLTGLAVTALALRLVTLGRPVAGDGWSAVGWVPDTLDTWSPARSFGARLPMALAGALTPPVVYALIRRTIGHPTALFAAIFLSVAPAHLALSQSLGPGAPACLLLAVATLALTVAVARDRPAWWWLYGLLLLVSVLLGPWSVALVTGHALGMLGWSVIRRLVGLPGPPLRSFLATAVLIGTFAGLYLSTRWTDPGPDPGSAASRGWMPLGLDHGAAWVVVQGLTGLGLLSLLRSRQPAPVFLLVLPAVVAWLLPVVSPACRPLHSLSWPAWLGVVVLASLGLASLGRGARALISWILPGRVAPETLGHAALAAGAVFLTWAVLPGLRAHWHRPDPASIRSPEGAPEPTPPPGSGSPPRSDPVPQRP